MTFYYLTPLTYTPEDNKTFAYKGTIMFKDCTGYPDPQSDNCDGWNFNKCPNDDTYCNPYVTGDRIFWQIPLDTTKYSSITARIMDISTNEVAGCGVASIQTVVDPVSLTTYYNITVNMADCSIDCWYLELTYNTIASPPTKIISNSEPFCLVKCNEKTMLITGYYTGSQKDCDGYFYQNIDKVLNVYNLSVRVRGTCDPSGYEITETVNNLKKVKSQQGERYLLRTQKIPYYVVKQIARCFNSEYCMVDGVHFSRTIKIDKNFEEGSMWILAQNIYIECTEINFSCE